MMPMDKEESMEASQILEELRKLMEKEKSDPEADDMDISHLENAVASLEKFTSLEENEPKEPTEIIKPIEKTDVVDTGTLTGPISGLKNFLMKKQQDNKTY